MKNLEVKEHEFYEVCDRCGSDLDQLKGEDIYLEGTDEVVCTDCHTPEDEKHWS